jgi:hypothetical protein
MKPVFTKEGKETVKNFIMNLAALQKEVVDGSKVNIGNYEIPTEDDILQDVLFFEEDFENGVWYPAVEDSDYGEWLFLKYGEDYIWE